MSSYSGRSLPEVDGGLYEQLYYVRSLPEVDGGLYEQWFVPLCWWAVVEAVLTLKLDLNQRHVGYQILRFAFE